MRSLPLLVACFVLTVARAAEIRLADPAELAAASRQAKPGDTLVLPSGQWSDVSLVLAARGTADAPITLRAAAPGQSVFTGRSTLRIAGEYLVVHGLCFRDPVATGEDIIEFRRNTRELAQHCRLTECAIVDRTGGPVDPASDQRWLGLYGADHQVDRCHFEGKRSGGATAVVWLGPGNEGRHRIEANYFGPRAPLGRNGGETLRVGDSTTSLQSAQCLVQRNLFERCDGEAECISNKSCDNRYLENVFLGVSGTLTLRQGNRCLVEGNTFLGENAKGSGGIRIIGEQHRVRRNYLAGLRGKEARSAITFMLGIPDSPLNGYAQVRGAVVEENVVVDCEVPLLIGLAGSSKATLPPVETFLRANRISAPGKTVVEAGGELGGVRWEGNRFFGKKLGIPPNAGIDWMAPDLPARPSFAREQMGPSWRP